jgi:hypothetical protein
MRQKVVQGEPSVATLASESLNQPAHVLRETVQANHAKETPAGLKPPPSMYGLQSRAARVDRDSTEEQGRMSASWAHNADCEEIKDFFRSVVSMD